MAFLQVQKYLEGPFYGVKRQIPFQGYDMSKLAKVYLAAAAAQISTENEDADDVTAADAAAEVEASDEERPADAPIESTDTPAEEIVAEEPVIEEAPATDVVEEPAAAEVVEETPAEEVPAADTPAEEPGDAPAGDTPVVEVSADEPAAAEEAPAEQEIPAVEEPADAGEEEQEEIADEFPSNISFTREGEGDEDLEIDDNGSVEIDQTQDFVQSFTEVREVAEADQQLEASVEGLTSIRETLEVMNNVGGVAQDAMPFVHAALEAYTGRLELPTILLGVALEAYESPEQRLAVSLEDLDETLALFTRARGELQQSRPSMEQRTASAGNLLSNTFGASSGSEKIDLQMLAALHAETDLNASRETLKVAIESLDGLENVRELIENQNTKGGLSIDALVMASLAMEAFTTPLNRAEIELVPSLETIARDQRVVVDLEKFDVALEGILDFAKDIADSIGDKARKTMIAIKNAVGMLNGTLPKTIEQLEAFQAKIEKIDGQGLVKEVDATGLAKRLHDGGKVPTNIPTYLIEFTQFASRFMGPFMVASQVAMAKNTNALLRLDYNSIPGFEESLKGVLRNWKDGRSALVASDFQATIPGEGAVFQTKEVEYGGQLEIVQKFVETGSKNLLHGTLMRPQRKLTQDVQKLPALSVAEMKKVSEALLKLLKEISPNRLEVDTAVVDQFWRADAMVRKGQFLRSRGVRSKVRKELNAVLDIYLYGTVVPAVEYGWSMARSCVRTTRTFLKYAALSMESPSTESIDTPAVEGTETIVSMEADVKELKPGKKVRFSHGHGVIKKIFTAPFKFKGKHHSASKDEPRFEVKDSKGYTTFHKASALKLLK